MIVSQSTKIVDLARVLACGLRLPDTSRHPLINFGGIYWRESYNTRRKRPRLEALV